MKILIIYCEISIIFLIFLYNLPFQGSSSLFMHKKETAMGQSLKVFLFFSFFQFYITAVLISTNQFVPFLHHVTSALRARLLRGFLPGHKITLGIILTAVIFSAFFSLFQNNLFSGYGLVLRHSGKPGQARNLP